ncbi:hypothetical protein DRQ20_00870 [bacterium]|nr:MAG: hypothetical protein DRQ20_00870 [bacterium]
MIEKIVFNLIDPVRFFLPNKHFLVKYYGGKIYLNLRESRMMMKRPLGMYEPEKTRLFYRLVRPGMTVIDVGVNKGYFTLLSAKLMGCKGKILAFEPEPSNCYWIRKSIEANKYDCIKLFELALADYEGEAMLYIGKKSGWHSLLPTGGNVKDETIRVKVSTLDNVLKKEKIERVNIVKIDVEGAEMEVLKGAKNLLQKSERLFIIMDLHPQKGVKVEDVFSYLYQHGFKIYSVKDLRPVEGRYKMKDIVAVKGEVRFS